MIAKRIKVKVGRAENGRERVLMRQEDFQYGPNGENYWLLADGDAVPDKFEVVESTECEASVLRESSNGWRKDPSWKPRVHLREDADQTLTAYGHCTKLRGFDASVVNNVPTFKRGGLTITLDKDLNWKLGPDSGKDPQTLTSILDTKYPVVPQESYRLRTEAAYRKMGLSLTEAGEAASIESNVLLESWTRIFGGSEEMAKAFLKGGTR